MRRIVVHGGVYWGPSHGLQVRQQGCWPHFPAQNVHAISPFKHNHQESRAPVPCRGFSNTNLLTQSHACVYRESGMV